MPEAVAFECLAALVEARLALEFAVEPEVVAAQNYLAVVVELATLEEVLPHHARIHPYYLQMVKVAKQQTAMGCFQLDKDQRS